jgi:hypothetical protein
MSEEMNDLENRPARLLAAAAATFEQRSKVYGDNYLRYPYALLALFPNHTIPEINGVGDASRLQLLIQILNKLTRYAENLTKGGHKDSAHDIIVYAAMLESETNEHTDNGR